VTAEFSPESQCRGKVPFTSKKAAKKTARRQNLDPSVRPYECPCGFWHNGHRPPAGTLAKARGGTGFEVGIP
jgi:hypothetical protein